MDLILIAVKIKKWNSYEMNLINWSKKDEMIAFYWDEYKIKMDENKF